MHVGRAFSWAVMVFVLAGLVATMHWFGRRTAGDEGDSLAETRELSPEPHGQPAADDGHAGRPGRPSSRAIENDGKPSTNVGRTGSGDGVADETRGLPDSRVPDRVDDRPEPITQIDSVMRRRLIDAGIDPAEIDRVESRLQQAAFEAAEAAESPHETSSEDPSDPYEPDDSPLADHEGAPGVTLDRIRDDMPAGMAGLIDGDQLVAYDGWEIVTLNDLRSAIYNAPPDRPVIATVRRNGESFEVWLDEGVLGARMRE